ncbi:MAG: polyphosphate polymerase domain-containing protein [Clostridia bacterium]|nr:polyphosphate polymerase domain-containing protein [Clostridia bacterium]
MQYRNEIKHLITPGDRAAICAAMKAVARLDPHAQEKGYYTIRSLYFDNYTDRALREKVDGINEREKFRIRYYDGNTSVIHLEKKVKRDSMGYKVSCSLTAEEAQRIVDGDVLWMATDKRALVVELYAKMKGQNLRPKTIVDYERVPFIYGPGNVRVTVDYNIRTGLRCTDFLNPDCVTIPAGEGRDIILEVKWDDYLPTIIRHAVQLKGRRQSAFSKYAQCRIYG